MIDTKYQAENHNITHRLYSTYLQEEREVNVLLPFCYQVEEEQSNNYAVVYMNDGQDMEAISLQSCLIELYQQNAIQPLIVVAVKAKERNREYGTTNVFPFDKQGDKAKEYALFLVEELIPFVQKNYRTLHHMPSQTAIMGFSLSGLAAFDIAWHYPHLFGKVGVFSGSFWWREPANNDVHADENRIMHEIIRQSEKREGSKFWLQTGTEDEEADRNNNGIIDAIDDTLDLIEELVKIGYSEAEDIRYVEVEGGIHHPDTWAEVLPHFLTWAFGKTL